MADIPDNLLFFPGCGRSDRDSTSDSLASPADILAEILMEKRDDAPSGEALQVEQVIEGHGNVQISYGIVTRQVIRGNGNVQLNGVAELNCSK